VTGVVSTQSCVHQSHPAVCFLDSVDVTAGPSSKPHAGRWPYMAGPCLDVSLFSGTAGPWEGPGYLQIFMHATGLQCGWAVCRFASCKGSSSEQPTLGRALGTSQASRRSGRILGWALRVHVVSLVGRLVGGLWGAPSCNTVAQEDAVAAEHRARASGSGDPRHPSPARAASTRATGSTGHQQAVHGALHQALSSTWHDFTGAACQWS
jgi:hypothetical protein